MSLLLVPLFPIAALIPADATAETDAEPLAKMFLPVLILTEETGHKWGDILVEAGPTPIHPTCTTTGESRVAPGPPLLGKRPEAPCDDRYTTAKQAATDTTVPARTNGKAAGAILRITKKVGIGALAGAGSGYVVYNLEPYATHLVALGLGYPLGVYLADARESSLWMTFMGTYLAWRGAALLPSSMSSDRLSGGTVLASFLGAPVLASELSRLLPECFHNPFELVLGKCRRPDTRVSCDLAPRSPSVLSAAAVLRF